MLEVLSLQDLEFSGFLGFFSGFSGDFWDIFEDFLNRWNFQDLETLLGIFQKDLHQSQSLAANFRDLLAQIPQSIN